jgi:hypothetical protein
MKRTTQIYSIFSQIDKVVAEAMAAEGKVRRIEANMIPPTALYDEHGRQAYFAIVMSDEYSLEYNERVANLRA